MQKQVVVERFGATSYLATMEFLRQPKLAVRRKNQATEHSLFPVRGVRVGLPFGRQPV